MSDRENITLAIDGMSCGHCVTSVRKALATVPGIASAAVGVGCAAIQLDTGATSQTTDEAIRAICRAGYEAALNAA